MRIRPMPRRPRLNYLRAFDAAARHLSFSRAAEELNLTQAAISQQIRQLETGLGAALFVRHNRSLTLSENGQTYYRVVREVLARLDSATDQLFPAAGKEIVTVHCTPSVATIWLAPRLHAFHRQHPDTEVHLRTTDLLPDRFRGQASDVEVLRLPAGQAPDSQMRKLWDMRIVPVCSPGFLAQNGPFDTADQICRQALIHTLGYYNDWHRWAHVYASPRASVASGFSVDGLVISVEAACRGEGIMLGRRPLIDALLEGGRLVEALPGNPGLRASYYLRTYARGAQGRSARVFSEWLLRQARPKPDGSNA